LAGAAALSAAALLGTAYATFVGVIFCHWAWFRIVAMLPAAVAALATLGIPVVGLLTSALVLGEPVGPTELTALVLVVGALAIVVGGLRGGTAASLLRPRAVTGARPD
jgi:drug/metabolite transporter (DMT)-like permease